MRALTTLLVSAAILGGPPLTAATITVTGTGDTIAADSIVTLREAIASVNAAADANGDVTASRTGTYGAADTIRFVIGTGAQTIAPSYPLPVLAVTVTIDGTTQPGYASVPLITIDGAGAGPTTHGLVILAPTDTVLSGIRIANFGRAGVFVGAAGVDHATPVAVDQSVVTLKNQAIGIELEANDPDDLALTFAIGAPPAHGSISSFNASAGTLTYTPGAQYTGADSFTFTANDGTNTSDPATVSISVVDAVPQNLVATAASASRIDLSWGAVPGATYQVDRKSAGGDWAQIATPGTNAYANTGLTAGTAHLYRVRSVIGGVPSANSNVDLGTTVIFTNHPLTAGVTVQLAHLTQLRNAALALKALAGQTPPSFTAGNLISAVYVTQLRTALDDARDALGLSTPAYTNLSLTGVAVKAIHVTELRDRAE